LKRAYGYVPHHLNPLKGHPIGQGIRNLQTLFPTAGLPIWINSGKWNLRFGLSVAEHIALHKRMAMFEDIARIAFNPAVTIGREVFNYVRDSQNQCGCN
jgi:hypothetical protein